MVVFNCWSNISWLNDADNVFFSGCDAILLGAETLRGLYPVETISTVGKICSEVNRLLPLVETISTVEIS